MDRLETPSSKGLTLELFTTMRLCETINTPRALTVWLLLKYGEFSQYLDLTIEPSYYEEPSVFRGDLLVTKVLSKSPNLPVQVDRKAVAVAAFRQSEAQCKISNDLAWSRQVNDYPDWYYAMKRMVSSVLEPLNEGVLDQIVSLCSHGPGSTTGVRGVGSSVVEKYQQRVELTANLYPFATSVMGDNWSLSNRLTREIVRGSRFTTVPKTAKTDRGICVEPTLNVYLQKGIGAYIRRRLRKFGCDLDVQADANRQAAKEAYSRSLATLDLSAASDSIAWFMLQRLIPSEWVHLLDLARSPCTKVNGEWVRLEKVSSMGNGFTFELESMIFLLLARSIVPSDEWHDVQVFGDDIIVPRHYAGQVIDALNFLGFSVNGSKSFLEGNFFESCGTDWFKGSPVRPFYLKGQNDEIPYAVQIANKLRLWSSQTYSGLGCDSSIKPLWLELLRHIPKAWRDCRVPLHLGDCGILTSRDEVRHVRSIESLTGAKFEEGYYIKTVSLKPKKREYRTYGVLLDAMTTIGVSDVATKGFRVLRGLFGKPRSRWTRVTSWSSGLEWDLRI